MRGRASLASWSLPSSLAIAGVSFLPLGVLGELTAAGSTSLGGERIESVSFKKCLHLSPKISRGRKRSFHARRMVRTPSLLPSLGALLGADLGCGCRGQVSAASLFPAQNVSPAGVRAPRGDPKPSHTLQVKRGPLFTPGRRGLV